MKTISIDGIEYIPKSESIETNVSYEYVIVRTYSAGVFAGYLKERTGKEVILANARRLWYWSGAASLSELAVKGTSQPDKCKFPCAVFEIILTEAIEIIPVTPFAQKSIKCVPVWTAQD